MQQEIKDNIYYLKDDKGNILLTIKTTDLPGNQVIIETQDEVYSGPIMLLSFN